MAAATGMVMLMAALAILAPSAQGLDRSEFPPGFLFGTATSAYQIEGAYLEDGKGLNNWDVFTHTNSGDIVDGQNAGDIVDGQNGDVAADHYHRYMEDVDIMHSYGRQLLQIFNFLGENPAKEEFDHYADVTFKAFGDRVKFWTTFNEPNLFAKFAYMLGLCPPKHCSPPFGTCNSGNSQREPYVAAHNMLMSYAAAVNNYKKNYQAKQDGSIGIVIAMKFYEPLRNTTEDILAARRALSFEINWFLDPIFLGEYPKEMREMLLSDLPMFTPAENTLLQNKVDFIGVNHYTTVYAKDCISSPCDLNTYEGNALVLATGERDGVPIGKPTALAGNYDVPEGMEQVIKYINQRYVNIPIYVTENGYSQHDNGSMEDLINDVGRIHYLRGYLSRISSALRIGANVRGYFVWSLIDNFEWAFGFTIRFGLYNVDFDTQERTPKMSVKWYRNFLMGSGPVDVVQTLRAES